ncbi:c-type cytochrome [Tautonia sociabilis]|uniref:C-type cytochrome n=1 Tax=Tautonia sociabilis TaxID=2080755 RepID=A0A432MGT6_9BACT|nr:c-type cytochrome [Tautonia sociabilis]RUL86117.1 c-type cytochrome [Tautonia sociabilis]
MMPTLLPSPRASLARLAWPATLLLLLCPTATIAAVQDSPMVRMLKSGRVPADRQGTLITLIGRQGSPADLGFLLELATGAEALSPENRTLALDALAEAARTRGVSPEGDRSRITALIRGDDAPESQDARLSAIRLAGAWEVEGAADALTAVATDLEEPRPLREAALAALADIGGPASRQAILDLAGPNRPLDVRLPAIASLARLDVDAAAERAVSALASGAVADLDAVAPLIQAFLDRQDGPDRLASRIRAEGLPADPAKLALRSMYSVGRTDPSLVAALSEAAGINAEPAPLTEAEMQALIADVQTQGDPARGELVFRRDDVNCMKCHAVSGAGGDIGPDLSAIGASSPPDYLIRSLLDPEEAVKEEYQVRTVLTRDGQIVQGIVKESSPNRIVLREATGIDRIVPTSDIEDETSGGSLMPKGLPNFLTRDEFVDLIAFLSVLGKPGEYAIRSTPTIQRWSVLPLPQAADSVDPDDAGGGDLPAAISSADELSWQTAYGKTAGSLPLDEVAAKAGSPVFALRGEIDVTKAGPLAFSLDATDGLSLWLDGEPIAPAARFTADLGPGRHRLILRVDTDARESDGLRVEVTRADGSEADFTVVGGS